MNENDCSTDIEMTKEEMQRYLDQQIKDGYSWDEALRRLAEVLDLRNNEVN